MQQGRLSFFDLFLAADPIVQAVMVGLVFASVLCWAMIADVWIGARRIARAVALRERGGAVRADALAPVFQAGAAALGETGREVVGERRLRVATDTRHALGRVFDRADRSLSGLAVIASAAPFVGLFGTVWGIMHSFASIAATQETSLAVVAPGIAEALLATALGLGAAIPAAIGHARLAGWLGRLNRRATRLVEAEVLRLTQGAPAALRTLEAAE